MSQNRLSLGSRRTTFKKTSRLSSRNKRSKIGSLQQTSYEILEPRQLLASIQWVGGDITGDNVVSTNGTSVFAISGTANSGATITVNGVSFVESTRANAGTQAQTQSPGDESISTTIGNDNASAFNDGGLGAIGDLIEGGWWGGDGTGNTASVSLTGLAVGEEYEIQIFANDARNGRHNGFVTRLDDGNGGTGIDLSLSNRPNGGSAGDYGIGTFIADATTQTIGLSGFLDGNSNAGRIQVNAIQLRLLESGDLLPGAHPLINEFSASNADSLDDDNGNSSDWIEIYNAGEDSVNLAGYSLTDDATNTAKYVFPNYTLDGGKYLIVFAADDADPTTGTDLYTGFGLSKGGEYLGFYDPAGNVVTEYAAGGADYPAQFTDISYGLLNDGTFSVPSFFATPTPRSQNVNPVDGVIDLAPTVSVDRGFYDTTFTVDIASQTPGASVAYTTDGTEPTLTNGTKVDPASPTSLVQFSLEISETTSLRTAAVKQDFVTVETTTHTYVFLDDVIASSVMDQAITQDPMYADLMRDALLDIPTLSFNYETVIVDSDVPEQPASIEWLAPDGSEGFQIDAGIKGFGGYFTNFAKKNFRVNFRSEYGAKRLDFPLFEGFDNGLPATDSFDSLDFRSGSHDMVQRGFYMSNRFVDDTLLEAGHVVPHGRFVHIYTNGVYWGQYHLRERWDADFLAQYYGGDKDDYEAINGNVNNGNSTPDGWSPGEVYDGDGAAWENIKLLADAEGNGNPTGGYQELKEVVNLAQYIDYMLVYMGGASENEYRAGGSADGSAPYTFTLNDADGWLRNNNDRTGNAGPGNILGTLVDEADPEFVMLFADRVHNMYGEGGLLTEARSVERLQDRLDEIELSFIAESARWGYRTPSSWANAADNAIQNIIPSIAPDAIADLRARSLFPNIDAPLYLVDGTIQSGGVITAGSELDFIGDPGTTVYYTTDGSDPRLVGGGINPNATAYAPAIDTTIFGSGSTWKFHDLGTDLGTAWQSPSFNDNSWASGVSELGYGDGDEATVVDYGSDPNDKHITTYFRKTFDVPTDSYSAALLRVKRDDGVIIYFNGVELTAGRDSRSNMPTGSIDFETTALGAVGGGSESAWLEFDIDPALLVAGDNTLAIEIHQSSSTSSDITFDAEFVVSTPESTDPYILEISTNVISRALAADGTWSAVHDATFVIPAVQSDLRITEINYHPVDPNATEIAAGYADSDDFEFVELYNPNIASSISLRGMQFSEGIAFVFGAYQLLPQQRVVIVNDIGGFTARYGNAPTVLGEWSGKLSNSGETITLVDNQGLEVMSVSYGDADPWSVAADGAGGTLVLDDPINTSVGELNKYYRWRSSQVFGGTPGAEPATAGPRVVINEILAHTDAPDTDSIELHNLGASSIDVGGWYLSDSDSNLAAFEIPAGTTIAAGGYLVFNENDFNPNPSNPGPNDFALSSLGEEVWLTRVVAGQTQFVDVVEFGATFNGRSLGRLPDGTGRLAPMETVTLAAANSDADVGPISISEINFHPDDPTADDLLIDSTLTPGDLEFVELFNASESYVDISGWSLAGEATYSFSPLTLLPNQAVVVVSFDPTDPLNGDKFEAFENHYGVGSSILVVGPFSGGLSNNYGLISLRQPDSPPADAPNTIPQVLVDEVLYDDTWHTVTDGLGSSLNRDDTSDAGTFVGNWNASAPTPGSYDANCGGCSTRKVNDGAMRPFGGDGHDDSEDPPTRELPQVNLESPIELSGSLIQSETNVIKTLADTSIRKNRFGQKLKQLANPEMLVQIWNAESDV